MTSIDLEDRLRPILTLLVEDIEGLEVQLDYLACLGWEEGRDLVGIAWSIAPSAHRRSEGPVRVYGDDLGLTLATAADVVEDIWGRGGEVELLRLA